jgi:hypothetical protein
MSRSPTPRYIQNTAAAAAYDEDPDPGWAPRHGLASLLTGVALSVLVLLVGLLAKAGPVASLELRVDRHIATQDRTSMLTTLAPLVALVVIAATWAGRSAALVLGGMYLVAVAASRVYLADHYPLDVLGSMLCALAAAFIVTGLAALPVLQPYLRRLDTPGGRHR